MKMTKMKKEQPLTVEHAHERLDVLEPKVDDHEKWIVSREKKTDRVFFTLIGGISFYVLDTVGLLEFIKIVS